MTNELIIINEESIKDKIYTIRGEKVMLDFDLARIYGYSTTRFNEQVKRNKEKFSGFMFKLTKEEVKTISVSHFATSIMQNKGIRGGRTYLPYAFTESGIYMLMTVLRGPLATEQSRKLITIFKGMKDYLYETKQLTTIDNVISLVSKINNQEKRITYVEDKLDVLMDNFIDPSKYKEFHFLDGEKIEAQEAYKTIFKMAKRNIYIFDNYISTVTLKYLKVCSSNIKIYIISDNLSRDKIEDRDVETFINETGINLTINRGNGRLHDRYIVIDYDTLEETIYHSGSSIKDSGNKITTIEKLSDTLLLDSVIKEYINR